MKKTTLLSVSIYLLTFFNLTKTFDTLPEINFEIETTRKRIKEIHKHIEEIKEKIRKLTFETVAAKGNEIHKKDSDGLAPLHRAIIEKAPLKVEALLAAGAIVNSFSGDHEETDRVALCQWVHAKKSPSGWAPLHFAAQSNHPRFIKILLLDKAANVNTQTKNEGITPLHIATYMKNPECVTLLLNHGADPFLVSLANTSPLFCAAQRGDAQTFKALAQQAESDDVFKERMLAHLKTPTPHPFSSPLVIQDPEIIAYLEKLKIN